MSALKSLFKPTIQLIQLFTITIVSVVSAHASNKILDRVVATYGTDKQESIFLSQIKNIKDTSSAAFKNAVDDLIYKHLLEMAIKQYNLKPTEQEINQQIASFASQSGITTEKLIEGIKLQGLSVPEYRKFISDGIQKQNIIRFAYQQNFQLLGQEQLIKDIGKIYDQDVKNNKVQKIKVYQIQQIVKEPNPLNDEATIIKTLKTYSDLLNQNKINFAQTALIYSDDLTSATNNGVLGEQPIQFFDPNIVSAIENLPLNKVTPPIKLSNSDKWGIFKVALISERKATREEYNHTEFSRLSPTDPEEILKLWKTRLLEHANISYYLTAPKENNKAK